MGGCFKVKKFFLVFVSFLFIWQAAAQVNESLLSVDQRKNNPNPNPSSFDEIIKYSYKGKPMVHVGKTVMPENAKERRALTSVQNMLQEMSRRRGGVSSRAGKNGNLVSVQKEALVIKRDDKDYVMVQPPYGEKVRAPFVEHIPYFYSEIQVLANSGLFVQEEIQIVVTEKSADFVFSRYLPSKLSVPGGQILSVEPQMILAQLNDRDVSFSMQKGSEGYKITVGAGQKLSPGLHVYRLGYFVPDMVFKKDGQDALFWNVTGDRLPFPIEQTLILVIFPQTTKIASQNGFLGKTDKPIEGFFNRIVDMEGNVGYILEYPLPARADFSVEVLFDEGALPAAGLIDSFTAFFGRNTSFFIGLAGLLVLVLYYGATLRLMGKEFEKKKSKGVVFNLKGSFSPAALRYVLTGGFDAKEFCVLLVSLASKGALKIKEEKEGSFSLCKTQEPLSDELSVVERKLMKVLFPKKENCFVLSPSMPAGAALLREKGKHFSAALKKEYNTKYFFLNQGYFWFGCVLFLLTVFGMALSTGEIVTNFVWPVVFGACATASVLVSVYLWQAAKEYEGKKRTVAQAAVGVLSLVLLVLSLIPLKFYAQGVFAGSVVLIPMMLGAIVYSYYALQTKSVLKQVILDNIEGYRLYLSQPAPEVPGGKVSPSARQRAKKLFNKHVPFSIAMDLEEKWNERWGADESVKPEWYEGVLPFNESFLRELNKRMEAALTSGDDGSFADEKKDSLS